MSSDSTSIKTKTTSEKIYSYKSRKKSSPQSCVKYYTMLSLFFTWQI